MRPLALYQSLVKWSEYQSNKGYMPFLPVLIKLKSRENNNLIFIVSHVTWRIKHPFFIIFFHYLRDHKLVLIPLSVLCWLCCVRIHEIIFLLAACACAREINVWTKVFSVSAVTRKLEIISWHAFANVTTKFCKSKINSLSLFLSVSLSVSLSLSSVQITYIIFHSGE